jgi:uncharacterized membrane protein YhaH (DUF805 family)
VSFGDSIKTCFTKYVDFKGRASRPEYWWFFLSYIVLYVIFLAIRVPALAILIALAYLLPLLAAAVRRLHDTGRSGWWYLIALVPLVGAIILIVYLASVGNPGSNAYGPPPGGSMELGSGMVPPPPPPA